ncbi:unnamed protein product [Effrenium voratum]|uniref:Uncharacterized protein n=1 Tax=Effrenium voratum TaxID=2562239 RepID=A0AA36IBX2_9DINO|nr:unnamed protein product [Effrenium voratum]
MGAWLGLRGDADIDAFYNSLLTGSGGDPPKGTVLSELIVKFFHGDFTPQGFKRYSGLWKGPPPGNIGKKDIAIGVEKLKEQMANPMFVTKGGVGYGVDETQKVVDDGKGWVWLAAEMSPGGLAVELFKAVPYGKRAVLVAKQNNVAELFDKVNWDTALGNIEKTFGGPQVWSGLVPTSFLPKGDAWSAVLAVGAFTLTRLCFVAPPPAVHQPLRQSQVALQARGGGEYDVSDADIDAFYNSLLTGSGGDPPKGTVLAKLIVKFFHGDFTPQGFKRYSGLWKGPPPGNFGKKDVAIGVEKLKEQMANPMFVTKGGVGYGVDETQKVVDDGKGWVWLAAEIRRGGLAMELFKAVPYGKRAVLVAKQNNVAELFDKVNWGRALGNIENTFGGPQARPFIPVKLR